MSDQEMIQEIEQYDNLTQVTFQMEDMHAVYFDCLDGGEPAEVKLTKGGDGYEAGELHIKPNGCEDWDYIDTIDIN